jgi:hypothetical protein
MRKTVEKITTIIEHFAPSVQLILLLDYIEELLEAAMEDNTSPWKLQCFAQKCIVKHTKVRF